MSEKLVLNPLRFAARTHRDKAFGSDLGMLH